MKFYLLVDPLKPSQFAMCSVVGTWGKGKDCKFCTRRISGDIIIAPLVIEWEPGTERIGDFSWGGYKAVVLDRARSVLESNDFECRFDRVIVKRPRSFLRSKMPRVAYPYKGPKLFWMRPTERVHIDVALSRIGLEEDCPCPVCGIEEYEFRRNRLVIRKSAWNRCKMFQIAEFGQSGATFVTESALKILDDTGLTNLCPRLAGEIR